MSQIAQFSVNQLSIRGVPIEELIAGRSFLEVLWLTLRQEEPTSEQLSLVDSMLIAWVDHGENPPSCQNVRNVASVKQCFAMATIAGLATFGSAHVPIEQSAYFLKQMVCFAGDEAAQMEFVKSWPRVPGFGHPVHTVDPRVRPLLICAGRVFTYCPHIQALHDAESCLHRRLNESDSVIPVHPNLAGITAAIWLDLGFEIDTVGLIPIMGRLVGWAAHYAEQRELPAFSGSIPH